MGHDPATDLRSDEDLLRRIAAGDGGAFATLFQRRQRAVYRFALHMSGAAAVADDVTQEVFLAVMRDAGRFEAGRASVVAWLSGIARNHVRRRLDSERSLVSLDGDEEDGGERGGEAAGADALSDMVQAERIEALRRAVGTLPLRYREVVVLCDLQEMTYSDAAAALGCAVGTVRSRLHRGRALLAAKLGGGRQAGLAQVDKKADGGGRQTVRSGQWPPGSGGESEPGDQAQESKNVRRGAEGGGRLTDVEEARVRWVV
ncbi:MAG: sigma-70 family RNA polymerase sigma factor [Acidobacteria bacterium]|nr:MAG: sigma-70 family RNA polymerase sigma factor [Acidobacteriota bacterium]